MRDFGFSVTAHHSGETVVVRPSGALDVMTAPRLRRVLESVVGEVDAVVVDLSEVSFADCAGLAPIRHAITQGTGATAVRIVGARPRVDRVLRLTGLLRPAGAPPG
jgi:stage II sporulation protein AA (anti-sigma F factor antagonist)